MHLENYVQDFAKSVQSKVEASGHEGVLQVRVNNMELRFAYAEYRNSVVVHTRLDMHNDSKEALQCLLEMNNLYANTQGLCLGIEKNIITAQQNIYIDAKANENLTKELFLEQCHLFCASVFYVRSEIYSRKALNVNDLVQTDSMLK